MKDTSTEGTASVVERIKRDTAALAGRQTRVTIDEAKLDEFVRGELHAEGKISEARQAAKASMPLKVYPGEFWREKAVN